MYIDQRGWKYKVMRGLGNTYKARYQKPDKHGSDGWHCVRSLPWRETAEEAQHDLDQYAAAKGWTEMGMEGWCGGFDSTGKF